MKKGSEFDEILKRGREKLIAEKVDELHARTRRGEELRKLFEVSIPKAIRPYAKIDRRDDPTQADFVIQLPRAKYLVERLATYGDTGWGFKDGNTDTKWNVFDNYESIYCSPDLEMALARSMEK